MKVGVASSQQQSSSLEIEENASSKPKKLLSKTHNTSRVGTPRKTNSELRKKTPIPLTPLIPISPEPPICRSIERWEQQNQQQKQVISSSSSSSSSSTPTSEFKGSIPPLTIPSYVKKKFRRQKKKEKKSHRQSNPAKLPPERNESPQTPGTLSESEGPSAQSHIREPDEPPPLVQPSSKPRIREPDEPPPLIQPSSKPQIREPDEPPPLIREKMEGGVGVGSEEGKAISLNSKMKMEGEFDNHFNHYLHHNEGGNEVNFYKLSSHTGSTSSPKVKVKLPPLVFPPSHSPHSSKLMRSFQHQKEKHDIKKNKRKKNRSLNKRSKNNIHFSFYNLFISISFGILCGFLFVTQNGINISLKKEVIISPWWTTLLTYIIGMVCLFIYITLFQYQQSKNTNHYHHHHHPPYTWKKFRLDIFKPNLYTCFLSGIFGPSYVVCGIYLIDKLSFIIFQYCIVFGIFISSWLSDYYGIFSSNHKSKGNGGSGTSKLKRKQILYKTNIFWFISLLFMILFSLIRYGIISSSQNIKNNNEEDDEEDGKGDTNNNKNKNECDLWLYYCYCFLAMMSGAMFTLQHRIIFKLKKHVKTIYHSVFLSYTMSILILLFICLILMILSSFKNLNNSSNSNNSSSSFESHPKKDINFISSEWWMYIGGICSILVLYLSLFKRIISSSSNMIIYTTSFLISQLIFSYIYNIIGVYPFQKHHREKHNIMLPKTFDWIEFLLILFFLISYQLSYLKKSNLTTIHSFMSKKINGNRNGNKNGGDPEETYDIESRSSRSSSNRDSFDSLSIASDCDEENDDDKNDEENDDDENDEGGRSRRKDEEDDDDEEKGNRSGILLTASVSNSRNGSGGLSRSSGSSGSGGGQNGRKNDTEYKTDDD